MGEACGGVEESEIERASGRQRMSERGDSLDAKEWRGEKMKEIISCQTMPSFSFKFFVFTFNDFLQYLPFLFVIFEDCYIFFELSKSKIYMTFTGSGLFKLFISKQALYICLND